MCVCVCVCVSLSLCAHIFLDRNGSSGMVWNHSVSPCHASCVPWAAFAERSTRKLPIKKSKPSGAAGSHCCSTIANQAAPVMPNTVTYTSSAKAHCLQPETAPHITTMICRGATVHGPAAARSQQGHSASSQVGMWYNQKGNLEVYNSELRIFKIPQPLPSQPPLSQPPFTTTTTITTTITTTTLTTTITTTTTSQPPLPQPPQSQPPQMISEWVQARVRSSEHELRRGWKDFRMSWDEREMIRGWWSQSGLR